MIKSLVALGLLILAPACGGSASQAPFPSNVANSSAPTSASGPVVTLTDFAIAPPTLNLSGSSQSVTVRNAGKTPHNLTIRDTSGKVLAMTRQLNPGESQTLSLTLAAGTYAGFCSLPGHESLGMLSSVVVGG